MWHQRLDTWSNCVLAWFYRCQTPEISIRLQVGLVFGYDSIGSLLLNFKIDIVGLRMRAVWCDSSHLFHVWLYLFPHVPCLALFRLIYSCAHCTLFEECLFLHILIRTVGSSMSFHTGAGFRQANINFLVSLVAIAHRLTLLVNATDSMATFSSFL